MHTIAPKTGNPLAVVTASFPAANQLAHRKTPRSELFTNATGSERCDFTR
jgi:hypothetical protein